MENCRVLVVEDEPIIGLELQETLEQMGFVVPAIVVSADKIMEAVAMHRPDVILMDIRLHSFIDGIDAARRLRMVSNVPIIYLSAYTDDAVRNRAAKTQPVAVLAKPVDEATLLSTIRQALAQKPA
jgi:CheY-like chemotaxis protein